MDEDLERGPGYLPPSTRDVMSGRTTPPTLSFPNLFLPGAAKSGTTTLHQYLSLHPAIEMAAGKEPHCLCRSDRSIDDYATIFGVHRDAKYLGDASTMYMLYPDLIPLIQAHTSAPKFIFVLRNPVDRAWSHYWWARGRTGRESLDFKSAFSRDLVHEPRLPCTFNNHYYHCGRYGHWLSYYEAAFSADAILTLSFDELVKEPRATLAAVWRFLGVADVSIRLAKRANSTGLIRYPSLFRAHSAMGRAGRRFLAGWLSVTMMERLTKIYLSSRATLLAATHLSEPPIIGNHERAWVAAHYASDMLAFRRSHPAFAAQWLSDFPV